MSLLILLTGFAPVGAPGIHEGDGSGSLVLGSSGSGSFVPVAGPPSSRPRRRGFFEGTMVPALQPIRGRGKASIIAGSHGRGSFVPLGLTAAQELLAVPPAVIPLTDPDTIKRVVVQGVGQSSMVVGSRAVGVFVAVKHGRGTAGMQVGSRGDGSEDETELMEGIIAAMDLFELAEIDNE